MIIPQNLLIFFFRQTLGMVEEDGNQSNLKKKKNKFKFTRTKCHKKIYELVYGIERVEGMIECTSCNHHTYYL